MDRYHSLVAAAGLAHNASSAEAPEEEDQEEVGVVRSPGERSLEVADVEVARRWNTRY